MISRTSPGTMPLPSQWRLRSLNEAIGQPFSSAVVVLLSILITSVP
jgi:hypothetical protein